MSKLDTHDVRRTLRTLLCHVGALQGSFPQVLDDCELARAHLLVLRRVLPQMTHLLRFTAEMVPLVEQVAGVAGRGSAQLGDVSTNLRNIDQAAETAVQEILTGLEQVEDDLRRAQDSVGAGQDGRQALESASAKLLDLFSALQFQDITSQKIAATHALLAQLEESLHSLVEQLGMDVEHSAIEVEAEGTYDPAATYDRNRAGEVQDQVDSVMESVRQAAAGEAEQTEQADEQALQADDEGEGAVAQADIDALVDGGT